MATLQSFCTSVAVIAMAVTTFAQTPPAIMDIKLVNTGSELEVWYRPDANFDQNFTSSVFTIRWETTSNVMLGNVQQGLPEVLYHSVAKSGDETDMGGYRYQVFAGFGNQNISATSQGMLMAGTEYKILSVPYTGGTSVFGIENDAWTTANNGDFYVSLNGVPSTGIVYGISTDVPVIDGEPSVTVSPNPSSGNVSLMIDLPNATDLDIDLLDPTGRVIWTKSNKGQVGVFQQNIDLQGFAQGAYLFRVNTTQGSSSHPLILE